MAKLIDSHAHLDYEYDLSVQELVEEARANGVETIIAIAAAPDSLERVAEIAGRFPNVYHTAGIHPHDAEHFTPEVFSLVKQLAKQEKCVAVGELGLDYYYNHSDRPTQHKALQAQLDFSAEIGKPIVLHTRDAEADTLDFLRKHGPDFQKRNPGRAPGVVHCFTASRAFAETALQLGYYISFSGIITFKNAEDLRSTARDVVPLDRILVETDSPYLAPIPHRGKKNHPAHTKIVAEKLAELKGLSLDALADHTTANTRLLFGIK